VQLVEAGIEADAALLLDAAAEAALVERIPVWRCAKRVCGGILDVDDIANQACPHCHTDFRETGDLPVEGFVYRSLMAVSRSVPWLIAVHGFNTRGPWQEEFSWRVANRFKHHAPVLIYKYGLVRFGVLFRWRHRALARQLSQRIRKAVAHARKNQIEEPPDIIIHSFGSQLFRLVLEMPESSDLQFGRVIAVGSVIRPDFDWSSYISRGRIEAVLCQCGKRMAQYPSRNSSSPTPVQVLGTVSRTRLQSMFETVSMVTRRRLPSENLPAISIAEGRGTDFCVSQ
jgi:hypothetical protein